MRCFFQLPLQSMTNKPEALHRLRLGFLKTTSKPRRNHPPHKPKSRKPNRQGAHRPGGIAGNIEAFKNRFGLVFIHSK